MKMNLFRSRSAIADSWVPRGQLLTQVTAFFQAVNKYLLASYQTFAMTSYSQAVPISYETLVLRQGQTLSIRERDAVGKMVVEKGAVWLTGGSSYEDVIVQTGEEFELKKSWPIVIEALTEARVIVWKRSSSTR